MKKEAVIYGIGDTATKTISYLSMKYDIVYAVDGNKYNWGKKWNGIDVRPPEELASFSGDVFVTTTDKFFIEISEYLLSIGIEKERIFRVQQAFCNQKEEIISLVYYDELKEGNIKEADTFLENSILVFCAFYSVYTVKLIRNMKKRCPELSFGVLSNCERYEEDLEGYADYFYVYHSNKELEQIIIDMPGFNVFQFLWIENIWVAFSEMLTKKCKRLNLCIGGSDFYRAREAELEYKRTLIEKADVISGETDDIIADFLQVYPEVKDRIRQVNFGIDVLDEIDVVEDVEVSKLREQLNISDIKMVITCGHNGNKSHQHIAMIHALDKMENNITEQACFVFPMTYPENNDSYIKEVTEALERTKLDYRILMDFMNEKQMAEYAVMSDVMLHVQTTDQLSSTMLEEMYAGTVSVVGGWLPYEMLKKRGIIFWDIDDIGELTNVLADIVMRIDYYREMCKINKAKIQELSSWKSISKKWIEMWK